MYKLRQRDFYIASSKLYFFIQFITRSLLVMYAIFWKQIHYSSILEIFLVGSLNDAVTLVYIFTVLCLVQILINLCCKGKAICKFCNTFLFLILSGLMFFILVAELMFWEEFGTRFNFIAVDYLIYTHEIIGTLKQDAPLGWVLVTTIFFLFIAFFYFNSHIGSIKRFALKQNILHFICGSVLCTILFFYYYPQKANFSSNVYVQELNKNGLYQLISAFYNNSLDYLNFYPTIDRHKGFEIVRQNVLQDNQNFLDNGIRRVNNPSFKHNIIHKNSKKLNVILVVVESLSAEFMEHFGNNQKITPYLDNLAKESVFFTNYYATGTRTVRGLEALLLSAPPTPGTSLVRKPTDNKFFTASDVFSKQGYDVSFIYGGYSYFDNMLNFFTTNQYKCIDRSNFSNDEISFANIWGVSDGDLFAKSIKYFDHKAQEHKPFFSVILTTSNHRPFTFPKNTIDLQEGTRKAGVKYTDYAIKNFILEAKKKPWFADTIFIITADHCASSAGRIHLPVHKYHIPLFIYAPQLLLPRKVTTLCSQIDVIPTLLGMLNFEYESNFWGRDVLRYPEQARAFVATYQMLGYIKDKKMVVLSPRKKPLFYRIEDKKQSIIKNVDKNLLNEAIAFYQSAYIFYSGH